jgi:protein tyrosine/serine phosphatase
MRIIKLNRIAISVLCIAVPLCVAPTAFAQNHPNQNDLPNFHRVNERLFRGGQPTEDGFKILSEMHIKTVVNLRDNDERARAEGDMARAAGFNYFNLPLRNFHKPDDERVAHILSIITAPENQPVFVHCKRGADRTGTIIAIYRIEYDGWTSMQAKDEAKQFGLGFWQLQMKDYIGDYYRRKLENSPVAVPLRKTHLR